MDNRFCERKALYEEILRKQQAYARRVFLLCFGIIGLVFALLGGILLLLGVRDEDGFLMGAVFAPLGLFFLLLGVVLWLCLGHGGRYSYEQYLKRVEKQGYVNSIDLYVAVSLLERRVERLEEELASLRSGAGPD